MMGGGGEDDVTDLNEIKPSSAVHGTVHSRPFFKETKKEWLEKQLVVIWADGNRRPVYLLLMCVFHRNSLLISGATAEHFWYVYVQWEQSFISVWCVCAPVSVCFPGAWTFLWFVCFCLLASQWGRTHDIRGVPMDAARATVAFSFFSIATWVSKTAVVFFSFKTAQILASSFGNEL